MFRKIENNLESMPSEIAHLILNNLDYQSLKNMMLVSQFFHSVGTSILSANPQMIPSKFHKLPISELLAITQKAIATSKNKHSKKFMASLHADILVLAKNNDYRVMDIVSTIGQHGLLIDQNRTKKSSLNIFKKNGGKTLENAIEDMLQLIYATFDSEGAKKFMSKLTKLSAQALNDTITQADNDGSTYRELEFLVNHFNKIHAQALSLAESESRPNIR